MGETDISSFRHTPIFYSNVPGISELQNIRAFVGQKEEQRKYLEGEIKKRYTLEDCESNYGVGYKIHDNQKDKYIFFTPNSRDTLEERYLERDEDKIPIENVLDLFARVAVHVAEADLKYNASKNIKPVAEEFLETLIYKEFMPNTPTLGNASR